MSVVVVNGMQQNPLALDAWSRFLGDRYIANVMELGTGFGGFAHFLSTKIRPGSSILTVDREKRWNDAWPNNVIFMQHDAHRDSHVLDVILRVMARPVLMMCDGGNKAWEANHYGALLQAGDFLAVHDYATDRDRFNERLKGKTWDWLECEEQAIAGVLADGFTPVAEDEFSLAAWGVWEKQRVDAS